MTRFYLPKLDYGYDALGRYISKDIMELHHRKHHQTYIDKLNMALDDIDSTVATKDIKELLVSLDSLPDTLKAAVRNHGGGHYNHTYFWKWMSPSGGGEPSGDLGEALVEKYGSFQQFVDNFTTESLAIFGSGWCWLMPDLSIITSPNQDNPLMDKKIEPLLGLDVWEHAYYLDYKNKRDDYVAAWWNVVDWEFVEAHFTTKKS